VHRASWEVTLDCDPQFMFGRILNLHTVHVRAFATAELDTINPSTHDFDTVPQSCNTPQPPFGPGCPAGTSGHAMAHLVQ
jgi:hypothetical protein